MQVLDEIRADRSPILKRTLSERMAFEYSTSRYLVATGFPETNSPSYTISVSSNVSVEPSIAFEL